MIPFGVHSTVLKTFQGEGEFTIPPTPSDTPEEGIAANPQTVNLICYHVERALYTMATSPNHFLPNGKYAGTLFHSEDITYENNFVLFPKRSAQLQLRSHLTGRPVRIYKIFSRNEYVYFSAISSANSYFADR